MSKAFLALTSTALVEVGWAKPTRTYPGRGRGRVVRKMTQFRRTLHFVSGSKELLIFAKFGPIGLDRLDQRVDHTFTLDELPDNDANSLDFI